MLCYLMGMEPYYIQCIKDEGVDIPKSQLTPDEMRVVNQDQRLKSIIISCLPDDIMESVISCEIVKATLTDLVYSFEGLSDTKENMIMDLKLDQNEPKVQKDYTAEYKKIKAKCAFLKVSSSTSQSLKPFQSKNKGLVTETFDWDEKEVSDDEEMTQVKVLMALVDDELFVGKKHARNGEWIDITMKKVIIFLSMDEDSNWQTYLKYINIDLKIRSHNTSTSTKTSLGRFFKLQGNSIDYQDHSLRERPGLGTMKQTKPETQESSRHNRVIHVKGGVLVKSFQFSESSVGVRCTTCGSNVHSATDHNDLEHFKRGEKNQATKAREPKKVEQNGVAERKNRTLVEATRTMLNGSDHLGKFDTKADDGYFLGYSFVSKAFRVINTRRQQIEENIMLLLMRVWKPSDDPSRQYQANSYISYYIIPHGRSLTELTQDNHVPEVITPNEQNTPHTEDVEVARIKAIRIFLAFATYMNFIVVQIDVKSVFLNEKLKEEVYVKQPPGFKSSEFLDYVFKLDKALYGLKQAPRA
nr:retrovirus-related Pol polyprotein from transposon TNT 1-94 [Tanacetum cinerariifolium]